MDYQWQTLTFNQMQPEELYAALRLRLEVFVIEQKCIYPDLDGLDLLARHMLCQDGDQLVAYQRLLPPGVSYPESSLGRIVVHPRMRGLQLGRELVQHGIKHNLAHWPQSDICISAQAHLQDFYASLGFIARGEEYLEDGIPHRQMLYNAT
jgi:ElaA protein